MNKVPCPAYVEEEENIAMNPELVAYLDNDPELVEALAKNAHVARALSGIERFHSIVRIEVLIKNRE